MIAFKDNVIIYKRKIFLLMNSYSLFY